MAKTFSSRLKRFEEQRLRTRLLLALIGSVTVLILIAVFGFRLFVSFAGMLGQMQGSEPTPVPTVSALVIPPYLDPLPAATGSGTLIITGRGQPSSSLILYVNDVQSKSVPIGTDGTFLISSLKLTDGTYSLKAKTADSVGKKSDFSNEVHTIIKRKPPALEITAPNDNITVNGDSNLLNVTGKTEEDTDVHINDRFVVVHPDGSFTYPYPLQDGENNLQIKATDQAGNSTVVSRKVTYHK